ncbi:putative protein CASP-like [Capsicum annuum]|uniref:Protein NIM1-INTERACTING 2-like n=1 Tax=Capsicum annuum TaxID=4072 RepID=A0A2G3A3A2_CAPAN|nr:protein NIM1-INTERACTING 2 [Capsicum annuum]KAF3645135.1 putative protein CASP-like [Capsicum annuum]KAF3646526.1 putative protein CASP-like [Capsicum annuum]PHT88702.1 hypothetical protein T459_10808 [Capsicum annuum]
MLLMDGEKKRKRTEKEVESAAKAVEEIKEETIVLPSPSEAEVNEFFAILRRMHVAVKYLQRNAQVLPENVNVHSSQLTAPTAGANGVVDGQKRAHGIVRKGVLLDLNSMPDGGE